ncbi:MAG: endolytic transglycosylase MltG [Hyphomicrobiaceae bacterium]|nr:endolytic transglycosylase MltG [Hyphomicrobiaceae bacterium]
MRSTAGWLNGVLTLILIAMLGSFGALYWFQAEIDRKGPLTTKRLVKIKSGYGTRAIAAALEQQGVIASRHVFLAYHLARAQWAAVRGQKVEPLKAGDYEFEPGASVRNVLAKIARGKSVLYAITIPEGLTSHAVVERLRTDQGLAGEIKEIPAEGFIKPDTYLVPRGSDRQMVLNLMLDAQRKFLKSAWQARQENLPLKDISEVLILASIVQRETGPKDQPERIASVFVNRLRKRMRLQSDPTILYGKYGSKVQWGAKIYRSDIGRVTSHNTYQITGLPPTPICNPGAIAIKAVLNPARTEDLYFVADGKGGHIFSRTNADHQRAVAKWRRIEKDIRRQQATDKRTGHGVTVSTIGPGNGDDDAASVASVNSSLGFPLPVRKPKRR